MGAERCQCAASCECRAHHGEPAHLGDLGQGLRLWLCALPRGSASIKNKNELITLHTLGQVHKLKYTSPWTSHVLGGKVSPIFSSVQKYFSSPRQPTALLWAHEHTSNPITNGLSPSGQKLICINFSACAVLGYGALLGWGLSSWAVQPFWIHSCNPYVAEGWAQQKPS